MTGNRRVRPCRPACRRGVRAVKLEPAGMAPTKIASAVYEIQYPAQMRQDVRHAVQAYNALSQALVEKKGKKGKMKQMDLKQYLPALELVETGETVSVPAELPAGNTLTVNPALLLDFLEKGTGLPPEAPRILRVALKTQEGGNFLLIFLALHILFVVLYF